MPSCGGCRLRPDRNAKNFFTSDLYLGLSGTNRLRGFASKSDHDKHIANCWNATVSPKDDVIVLGELFDLSLPIELG